MMSELMEEMYSRLQRVTWGCYHDMHEPDEQGISAVVKGDHLDNAMGDNPETNCGELTVGITNDSSKTEWFNLATLIALAKRPRA